MLALPTTLLALAIAPAALAQVDSIFHNLLRQAPNNDVIIANEIPNARFIFPPSRGTSSLVETIGPCQGYELSNRADYPVTGGTLSWVAVFDLGDIHIRYSTSQNPTTQADFQDVLTNVTGGWAGQQCVDGPNFDALGLGPGDNVTIQFYYKGGPHDEERFECADLNLVSVDDFNAGRWERGCVNYVQSLVTRSAAYSNPHLASLQAAAQASSSASAAASASAEAALYDGNDNGTLTLAQAGVIGAMVTLAVLGFVVLFAWGLGFAAFGSRVRAARAKHGSFVNSDAKTVSSE